jgi:hypothetical protein
MQTLFEIPFHTKTGTLIIRLLGRPHTVDVVAVTIPDTITVSDEQKSKWVQEIGNHMVAVLRLTHDVDVDVLRNGDGLLSACTEEVEDPIPRYPLFYSFNVNDDHVADVANMARVFAQTLYKDIAPIMSLIAESQTPSVPTHYKVLSLIRALELLIPDDLDRANHLNQYEERFQKLEVSAQPFKNFIPVLRTRCAHGVSRGRVTPVPLVSQVFTQEKFLVPVLRLLRAIVFEKTDGMCGVSFPKNYEQECEAKGRHIPANVSNAPDFSSLNV